MPGMPTGVNEKSYFPFSNGLPKTANGRALRHVLDVRDPGFVDAAFIALARRHGYGVTGNFVVDPAWRERDFERLWTFVERHQLYQAGFTILTPLPGTELFQRMQPILEGQPWFKYDMNHLLYQPHLGAERFFELYADTWRRSILNLGGHKSWTDWVRQVRPGLIPYLTRMLLRTQRMMNAKAYLAEHDAGVAAMPIQQLPEALTLPARMEAAGR